MRERLELIKKEGVNGGGNVRSRDHFFRHIEGETAWHAIGAEFSTGNLCYAGSS